MRRPLPLAQQALALPTLLLTLLPTLLLPTLLLMLSASADASPRKSSPSAHYILADAKLLKSIGVETILLHERTQTALAKLSEDQLDTLSQEAHRQNGACGGHELLHVADLESAHREARTAFQAFDRQLARDQNQTAGGIGLPQQPPSGQPTADPAITALIDQVDENNLRATVQFLTQQNSRNHKSGDGQRAAEAFKLRIADTLATAKVPYQLDFIAHSSTPMKSIRLTVPGSKFGNEIIVLGGHLDSINQSFWGGKLAPGSDDNASGSANILEVARLLTAQATPPERTVEFYWYAGEEGGLLGSAEIAKSAKDQARNIVGVIQLDMTLFPGDGEFTLGSMTDFTSVDMRDRLRRINSLYAQANIVEDKCGYGCSDHASWYKNGFPTLMPFESTKGKMNGNIHSDKDTVNAASSFKHSAIFSKLALAMILGW